MNMRNTELCLIHEILQGLKWLCDVNFRPRHDSHLISRIKLKKGHFYTSLPKIIHAPARSHILLQSCPTHSHTFLRNAYFPPLELASLTDKQPDEVWVVLVQKDVQILDTGDAALIVFGSVPIHGYRLSVWCLKLKRVESQIMMNVTGKKTKPTQLAVIAKDDMVT